jgi:hypothetical protein
MLMKRGEVVVEGKITVARRVLGDHSTPALG